MTDATGRDAAATTKPIPTQSAAAPRRRRRWPRVVIALTIVVVLLIAALLGGESVFRTYATGQVEKSVEATLPKGVTGTVKARILGSSALWQWLHGSFDHVTLTSTDLKLLGKPASASIDAYGLPVAGGGSVKRATGTLRVSQAALQKIAPLQSADVGVPRLGAGTVSTTIKRTILLVPITADVTLKPSVDGKYVHLAPIKAEIKSGGLSVPGTAIIKALLPNGISVCIAEYLPPSLTLTTLQAKPGSLDLTFVGTNLNLDTLGTTKGSCK